MSENAVKSGSYVALVALLVREYDPAIDFFVNPEFGKIIT